MWTKLQEASLTVQSAYGPLNLKTDLPDRLWNSDFETLCVIENHGQGDTMISPRSAAKYGLWMVLALYEITLITSRCRCIDCRYLSTVIQSRCDPKVLTSILQDVISNIEDKNLDPVRYRDWLTHVNSFFRGIEDLLCSLADGSYPIESKKYIWMGEVARAQIRQLIKWLEEPGGIPSSEEVNEARKRILKSLADSMNVFPNILV